MSLQLNRSFSGQRSSAQHIDVTDADIRALGYGLIRFLAQEASAVFFGLQANYNVLSGSGGAMVIDKGTGNTVIP